MTNPEIKATITEFITLIEEGADSPEENVTRLMRLLDALVLSVHYAHYTSDDEERASPPKKDYQADRRLVTARFPEFGLYNVVDNVVEKVGEPEYGTGDAIDDIADIYGDMRDVLWRWDHNGEDDALWYFKDFYTYHWKRHVRNLQLYLCEWEDAGGDGK